LTILQSLFLGIIQGLTEFLPISSTAHLVLAPTFFGFAEPPHAFDVALHIGTLLAVLVYFREDWIRLIQSGLALLRTREVNGDPNRQMALLVVLGCIPAGLAGLALQKVVEPLAHPQKNPVSYLVMATTLIGVGLLMAWVDRVSRKTRSLKNLGISEALFVGMAQAVALIPGVSRSGATITAGLVTGLTREAAARFSFLLSAPITLVAAAYGCYKLVRHSGPPAEAISAVAFVVGILASGVVGWACIHFLLEFLKKRSLWIFVWYRMVLGGFLLLFYVFGDHA
jgi:undecaprenyl-diphosphatase